MSAWSVEPLDGNGLAGDELVDPTLAAFMASGILRDPDDRVTMRTRDGETLILEPSSWHAPPCPAEEELLAGVVGPVLDIGCGPGRLVSHLAGRGVDALGVDVAPDAVASAAERGVSVLRRSVWDRLPGEGTWRTVLLVDGNVGIGGDPTALLARCGRLLADGGLVIVEVGSPGQRTRPVEVRLEAGERCTDWFPWAVVSVRDVARVARRAGLSVSGLRRVNGRDGEPRWFAELRPVAGPRGARR